MMAAFRFYGEALKRQDTAGRQRWDSEGELWRARSFACSLYSGNFAAGAMNLLALAELRRFKGDPERAVNIADLAGILLEYVNDPEKQSNPPLDESRRIYHEQRARFLCESTICESTKGKGNPGALDVAIAEAFRALQFCDDDRARLKVSGGIANMTLWNGDKEAAIEQTQQVLDEAVAQGLHVFAEIARRNLGKVAEGDDELEAYQVA